MMRAWLFMPPTRSALSALLPWGERTKASVSGIAENFLELSFANPRTGLQGEACMKRLGFWVALLGPGLLHGVESHPQQQSFRVHTSNAIMSPRGRL